MVLSSCNSCMLYAHSPPVPKHQGWNIVWIVESKASRSHKSSLTTHVCSSSIDSSTLMSSAHFSFITCFVIKTSGWKALKDHTCLMKVFWGLRKSKNLPKKNSKFAHVLIYWASLSVPGLQKYMVQKNTVFCIPPAPAYDMYHTSKYTLGLFSYISFCRASKVS